MIFPVDQILLAQFDWTLEAQGTMGRGGRVVNWRKLKVLVLALPIETQRDSEMPEAR